MPDNGIPLYEPVESDGSAPELITPTEYHKILRAASEERAAFARAIQDLSGIAGDLRQQTRSRARRVRRIPDTNVWVDPGEVIAMQVFESYYSTPEEEAEGKGHLDKSLNLELVGGASIYLTKDDCQTVIDFMEGYWQR